jgi:hypothetical protein
MTAPARKRCKMDGAVSRLTLEDAAAHLDLSVDDFEFHLLLGRIPPPVDGRWDASNLVLRRRGAGVESKYRSGLYVVQFMGFVKIGFSDKLLQRLAGIQDSLPLRIKIHRIIDGATRKRERSLHQRFRQYRTRGEWFRYEGRLAAWIEGGCK